MTFSRAIVLLVTLLSLSILTGTSELFAQESSSEPQGFFRFPDVSQDKIVFTSEGDLWIVPINGGNAVRLTTAEGEERFAKFSPDGKWIAFTGEYDGNNDVYVIPVTGGEPTRLTFHPWSDQVVDWTPDGKILFRSMSESGNYYYKLFTVSPKGGYPEPLPLDKAATLAYEPNGSRVAFSRTMLAFRTWKRYRGGWAEDIWVGNMSAPDFKKITKYTGNDQFPMWLGDRIFFLSDSTGRANIWSLKPDGNDLKQVTTSTDYDIRFPSASTDKIVYQHAMDIWILDITTGKTAKVDITLPSDRLQRREKFVDAKKSIDAYDLSPDGKRMVVTARGEMFSVSTKKDALTRRISFTPSARERSPMFSPDGKSVLAISDATGEEELWLYDAMGVNPPTQLSSSKAGWHYEPFFSPDGKWIAYTDYKCRLNLFNVAAKTTSIADSASWEIRQYTWSPDSRYIAYAAPIESGYRVIRVYDLTAKKAYTVTESMFNSNSPSWDPESKYLYFTQDVNFNPYLCHVEARFIFNELTKPFVLVLKSSEMSPFAPKAEGEDEDKGEDAKKPGNKDKKDKGKADDKGEKKDTVKVQIDFDGIVARKVEVDVPSGNYDDVRAVKSKFYYVSSIDRGLKPEGPPDEETGPLDLHVYDLKAKKDTVVISGINSYDISDDGSSLVVKKGDDLIKMDAAAAVAPSPENKDAMVNLDDVTLEINPRDEWKQMYNEAWRLERDFFYDPKLHGLDWLKIKEQYGGLIERISTRDELNDLIGETISELAAGHTYVSGGDKRLAKPVPVGMLGIDVVVEKGSNKYKITRILAPHPGEKETASPLADPGLGVKVGDYLLGIDNQAVDGSTNYMKYLVNKAGKLVQLTMNDKPTMTGAKQIVIKPMASEEQLRYDDWVEGRRQYVDKASNGKLGYIHLSDMGSAGLSEFGWQYPPQFKKEGLVIDVRYNGGGFVAEMILSYLERKVWAVGRYGGYGMVSPTPTDAFYGHMAVICNGETGSDGETFTEGTKALKLGPVIGERTWGGWVGIRGDKPLEDRGSVTMPEFPGWSLDGKWLIEGWGSDPDIVVVDDPVQKMAGKDPQLDYTIDYLIKKIASEPRVYPPHPPYPDKSIK